jgi:hypothetical protein
MANYSELTHRKWGLSIVMLVYQRIFEAMAIEIVDLPIKNGDFP